MSEVSVTGSVRDAVRQTSWGDLEQFHTGQGSAYERSSTQGVWMLRIQSSIVIEVPLPKLRG